MSLTLTAKDIYRLNNNNAKRYRLGDLLQEFLTREGADQSEDTAWGSDLANVLPSLLTKAEFNQALAALPQPLTLAELQPVLAFVANIQNAFGSVENLMTSINTAVAKVDKLNAALAAHAAKIDADAAQQNAAVTGSVLDTDYAAAVVADLQ